MAQLIPSRRSERRGALSPFRGTSLTDMRRYFDNLMDQFFRDWPMVAPFEMEALRVWDIDVEETDKEVYVRADLPGFEENELDVQLQENVLTIKAEKEEKGKAGEQFRSYQRSVTLPVMIDPGKVEANYHNGVLELHLPKSEEARARRIPIGSSQGRAGTSAPQSRSSVSAQQASKPETT